MKCPVCGSTWEDSVMLIRHLQYDHIYNTFKIHSILFEEVSKLKEEIKDLESKISQLDRENSLFRKIGY